MKAIARTLFIATLATAAGAAGASDMPDTSAAQQQEQSSQARPENAYAFGPDGSMAGQRQASESPAARERRTGGDADFGLEPQWVEQYPFPTQYGPVD